MSPAHGNARLGNKALHSRALSVAAGLPAHRRRAIRITIDRQVARGVSFREAWPALKRAARRRARGCA